MSTALISTSTQVESPFIIVKIGDYTFGNCSKSGSPNGLLKVTYPNYMTSISVVKVNGAVNTYTIVMDYAITQFDDPNMMDRVLGTVSKSREIIISYGDWGTPAFIYKEEKAVITKVSQRVDFNASKIQYTIKCTSTALALQSVKKSYNAKKAKPSEEIIRLLKDESTGLLQIFSGMRNHTTNSFANLIAQDDIEVQLEAKDSINVLDYIAYLVSCMTTREDSNSGLKNSVYYWAVYDDTTGSLGGQYFKVVKVTAGVKYNISYNTYEVDVGFPTGNQVMNFTINSDSSWSIIYDYSTKMNQQSYTYSIDDDGNIRTTESPSLMASSVFGRDVEANKTWWSNVTQFPITATLTIKGLLRPTMLMSYVKINSYFYGHKHMSSGLYIITKQEDTINSSGYKTTLSLTRLSGDEEYDKS